MLPPHGRCGGPTGERMSEAERTEVHGHAAGRFDGTYTRDGDSVTVIAAGETRMLRIDGNGRLDGGSGNSFFSGVICKKS